MQITIIACNNVNLEDIEMAFKDSRSIAINCKRKYFLEVKTLPASNCSSNDCHIIFVKKKEMK